MQFSLVLGFATIVIWSCGGLYGSEPPAFQRAEVERLSKESVKRLTGQTPQNTVHNENGMRGNMEETDNIVSPPEVERVAPDSEKLDKASDNINAFESSKEAPADESDTLSDIDDFEVMGYLHNEEESRLKKQIWEQIPENREYMQEQAAKEAAAVAARALNTGTSEEIREAQALAAKAAQAVASKKEKDKRKRELEAKNAKPAQTAAEAAGQHFKKKLSSKINYDVLNDLFGDEEPGLKKNCVDDGNNTKGEEIANDDDNNINDEDDEWNYDNEHISGGYVDDDFYQDY